MGYNVYVTRRIPEPALVRLRSECEKVEVNPEDRSPTRAELLENVRGRDGILCMLTDTIDEQVMRAATSARGFANCAVGYNNIAVHKATELGLVITNTPGVLTDATADLTWALLLATARRIIESDRFVRAGRFREWGPMLFLGADVTGRTLGIVGAGRIGSAVARRARGFDMQILYCDPTPNEAIEKELGACRVSLDELLAQSDFVSVHVPLTDSTRRMFGAEQFRRMKRTAIFVNTARGLAHDEASLAEALRSGTIAGAGLDVYENEPQIQAGLAELDNVVLAAHIGSATIWTRTRMALMAAENLLAIVKGERAPNCVNPEVYDSLGKKQAK
ncbi:D-glycerate dehydrogenase [Candidatus Sumerlaeota bacterium]|nr:D-glycerate dehydrogenase [Candidatus Sumerlaeota bacterium]